MNLNALYGNGGLSVRSKQFVIFCINLPQYQDEWNKARLGKGLPEDIFFSRCLFEHFQDVADADEARAFAAEETLEPFTYIFLAVHDPCRIAEGEFAVGCSTDRNRKITRELTNKCPESRRVLARCVAACGYGAS